MYLLKCNLITFFLEVPVTWLNNNDLRFAVEAYYRSQALLRQRSQWDYAKDEV